MFILLAFIIVPTFELVVLLQTGALIGLWPTLTIIILTALVGSALLKKQGLSTLARFQKTVHNGELPLQEMFDGLFLLIAGILLLTPGFVTDGFGLILFFPFIRNCLLKIISTRIQNHNMFTMYNNRKNADQHEYQKETAIIDGECYEIKTKMDKSDVKNPTRSDPS